MNWELVKPEIIKSVPPKPKKKKPSPTTINMAFINAVEYCLHSKWKTPTYITSLQEINKLIAKKQHFSGAEKGSDKAEIEEQLPEVYREFKDVFSKEESDKLPPFQKNVDFDVKLEPKSDPVQIIGHAPLYKMNAEELEAVKEYLEANLEKGFIIPSSAPFASPILMVHNGNKLHFCVDYRKLNAISKKD